MACRKIAYDTWQEAQKVVNRIKNRRIRRNGVTIKGSHIAKIIPKRVYKCPQCKKFHLTHFKTKLKLWKEKLQ